MTSQNDAKEKKEWWDEMFISNPFGDEAANPVRDYVRRIVAESRRRTIEEIEEIANQTFKEGHGGGNWRRLNEQFLSRLSSMKEGK